MEIAQKYSHLNGEEFLIVHHPELYSEIKEVITAINANGLKSKISNEKTKKMQSEMSSGIAYFAGEVYKVMRQGRNHPAVPLLILGVER
ncbi:MAG: hypothetical protein PWQ17_1636 [Anaerophaga sp.]|uniref:hypothetical protein n=1 Tax=Anaerophaga thermohalophila TaxID=177400 RepID=UPI000237C073|nr:hypothetical protein [Anaerophaga thermohalophila]MDK2842131.1 hypothetical protein [Anaerophaga sp.]